MAYNEQERKKIEIEAHRLIVTRDPKHTNFLEVTNPTNLYAFSSETIK